jgi:hypothetical protein
MPFKSDTDFTDLHCFFDADCAENAEMFLASFVYLANFAPKASFVTKLCLRPQGHKNGLLEKLTKKALNIFN